MRNSKNMIKDSLDRQIDPSEAVEIHVPDVIPEIQIIEPHELHVGKNPDYRRKTQRDIWDSQYRLPDTYGSTEIVLMVRDPYWVYAYWEIADDIPRAVTAALGPEGLRTFRKALRVHDVTDIEFDGVIPTSISVLTFTITLTIGISTLSALTDHIVQN